MRCAIYARYSSDLQRDRSIDDQIESCRRFATQRNWVVLNQHIYADRAISGASVIGRTGLLDLLRVVQTSPKPFDYLLVDDTSRLSRKPGEVENIIDQLRFHGIHVFFVSQSIDSADKQAHLSVGVNSLLDSQYRRDLAAKTLRGMAGQAVRGYNTCGRLYGYRYIKVEDESGEQDRETGRTKIDGTRIEIDDEQAEVVQRVFRLYGDGLSIRDIAHYLNEKGHLPPGRKSRGWIPNTVRNMLANPKYFGDWTFNKMGWVTNPETGQRRRVPKDASEWTVNPQPRLAIVPEDVWKKVQDKLETNRRGPNKAQRGPTSKHLFSGSMTCHACGGNYVLVTGSDRPNPSFGCCTNKQRGKAACPNNFRVSKNELETVLLSDVQKKLLTPPILSAIVNLANKKLKSKLSQLKAGSSAMFAQRRKLAKKLSNLVKAIENGSLSPALQKRLAAVEAEISDIDIKLEVASSAFNYENLKLDETAVQKWLTNLRELLSINPAAAKAELVPLIGQFELSPEVIDGVKYLRVKAEAQPRGLLMVATGGRICNMRNTGGQS